MEINQQFNLRWNNHTNNILQVFSEHLSSEHLVDVTLSCEGQFLKVHRMILSACSPYFQELFKHHGAKHPLVILNGIKYTDLRLIIKFMYIGEIRVQEAELDELLAAAESLQVKGLSNVRNKYEKGEIRSKDMERDFVPIPDKDSSENPVTEISNGSNNSSNSAEKDKLSEPDPPRIRKRRKMSHTVNELAKETVFTSNGTVCSDGESSVAETDSETATIKVEPPDLKDICDENEIDSQSSNETKTLRVKGKGKSIGQKAITVAEKVKLPGKIPRPPNAFMIFANEWRRKMAFEYPNESNKEISVRLGVMWKGLNLDAKEAYYASAKKADEEHKRKYPGYYYSPKEARLRKNLKHDLMLARYLPTNIRNFYLIGRGTRNGERYFGGCVKISTLWVPRFASYRADQRAMCDHIARAVAADVDALRLVKVFMNADERQGNMVVVSPNDGEVDRDGEKDKDSEGNDRLAVDALVVKEQSSDHDKNNVALTSVSI